VAVPTTSGTGAEVTAVAVVTVPEQGLKTALRGPGTMATLALVDPELTFGLPPNVTASTGMDALAHAVESYLSVGSSAVSESFAERAVGLILTHLAGACAEGSNPAARSAMAEGSCLAGVALAQSGAALGHGFGMALGGPFDVDHGALVGLILPEMLEFSLPAVTGRLARLARRCEAFPGLTAGGAGGPSAGDSDAAAALIKGIRELIASVPLPAGLPAMGITPSALGGGVRERVLELIMIQAGTKNHPFPVDRESAAILLDRLLS
jgi:alcohol dehydrogenase class IV